VQDCLGVPGFGGGLDDAVHEALDRAVAGEVVVDKLLRLGHAHADAARESEGALPVDDPEVDGLALRAHLAGNLFDWHAVDLGGDEAVYIPVRGEGLHQGLVLREVRQQPQLDLRVVGAEDAVALPGRDKRRPDFPPQFGPDRDVLQVRPAGAEPAGRGYRLVERGMHPVCPRIDKCSQFIDVGILELREGAVVEDEVGDGVVLGEFFEDCGVGAAAGFADSDGGELEFVEENCGQLLGGIDVEYCPGVVVDLVGEVFEGFGDLAGHFSQDAGVEGDAVELHCGEDGDEGHLDLLEEGVDLGLVFEAGLEVEVEAVGYVGVLGGVFGGRGRVDHVEGELVFALADEVGDRDAAVVEEVEGHCVHRVLAGRVEAVGGYHRVEVDALDGQAGVGEYEQVVLDILADLFHVFVGQNRRQVGADLFEGQVLRTEGGADGEVKCLVGLP